MELCIICKKEFKASELDFVGRCTPCFKQYLQTPIEERPDIGVPFTPVSKAVK